MCIQIPFQPHNWAISSICCELILFVASVRELPINLVLIITSVFMSVLQGNQHERTQLSLTCHFYHHCGMQWGTVVLPLVSSVKSSRQSLKKEMFLHRHCNCQKKKKKILENVILYCQTRTSIFWIKKWDSILLFSGFF